MMDIIEIADDDEMYRRFSENFLKDNGKISSAAFQNTSDTDEMSSDLAILTTPHETALNNPNFGVASFYAGGARELDQKVFHNPVEDNPAHSTIKGRKPPRIRKKFAKISNPILFPNRTI